MTELHYRKQATMATLKSTRNNHSLISSFQSAKQFLTTQLQPERKCTGMYSIWTSVVNNCNMWYMSKYGQYLRRPMHCRQQPGEHRGWPETISTSIVPGEHADDYAQPWVLHWWHSTVGCGQLRDWESIPSILGSRHECQAPRHADCRNDFWGCNDADAPSHCAELVCVAHRRARHCRTMNQIWRLVMTQQKMLSCAAGNALFAQTSAYLHT